jgi:hypothetical protein
VYTQVLDGSLREAVDKVGGELITIVQGRDVAAECHESLRVALSAVQRRIHADTAMWRNCGEAESPANTLPILQWRLLTPAEVQALRMARPPDARWVRSR